MDTIRKIRNFISSQNLYAGVRMTVGVLVPAIILYHHNLLASGMALPLGALFTGLGDSPGPLHHRRNSFAVCIIFNFIIILIAGSLRAYPPFILLGIVVFGMFCSLIAVYGTRVSSIGLIALIVFIFHIDGHLAAHITALHEALLFSAGGIWYSVLSLLLSTLRPYKLIQQLLGECIIQTSNYLMVKASFYKENPDPAVLYDELMKYQINIRQTQDDLREILFKTRRIVSESTVKGRVLMSVFMDSVDLQERIMTSQFDYLQLQQKFGSSGFLQVIAEQIKTLAAELHEIGLALQSGTASNNALNLDELQRNSMDAFIALRRQSINANTLEDFIALRQILYSLQDITERIKRLHYSTRYDKKISKEFNNTLDLEQFISHREIDPQLFIDNLTLKSANFRHATRVTVALLIGYGISLFFPIGHSYWTLLTIATIIKPAYSITKQRNVQRVSGTAAGALAGFLLLFFVKDNTALFLILIVIMILSYSLLKINYFLSSAGITIYVLISLSFLSPDGFRLALTDRLIDTAIGGGIAYFVAILVLPTWEHQQIEQQITEALEANRNYFKAAAQTFIGKPADETSFKLYRKNAFVALANLSDNFQRMLSEPINKQRRMEHYHQFVATSHTLTSYIASLSYYAQRSGSKYVSDEFIPIVHQIDKQFVMAGDVLKHHQHVKAYDIKPALPVSRKVQELLTMRRKELNEGLQESEMSVRKILSDLKTIHDQFEMISTITVDEIRILEKITET